MIILIAVLVVLAAVYITLFRYALVGKSIDADNTMSTALLLSPELAYSFARIF